MTRYRTIVADPPWPYETRAMGWQAKADRFIPYETMTLDDIASLPVAALGVRDAHLYLWTTNRFLWDARNLADQWGFRVLTVLTWCKPPRGTGMGGMSAYANTTEFVLFCRGRLGSGIRQARERLGMTQHAVEVLVRGNRANRLMAVWEADKAIPTAEDMSRLCDVLGLGPEYREIAGEPGRWDSTWFAAPRRGHSEKPETFLDMVEQMSPGPYVELFARRARFGWDYWGNESLGTAEMSA